MGGKKTKISMEKIVKKDSRSVAFSKRRKGLYCKTSELCLRSGAQVAILATPVSSKSSVSFYTFGHSSVDNVVSAFLANQRPPENLGQRFWWEDESLAKSENTKELSDAIDSISSMLQNLRSAAAENREDVKKKKKKDVVLHETHQELDRDQTLNVQTSCASICIRDDPPANFEGFVKNSGEEDQIAAISDTNNLDGCNHELDLDLIVDFERNPECLTIDLVTDDVSTNRFSCSGSEAAVDGAMVIHSNSFEDDLNQFSGSDEDNLNQFSGSDEDNLNQFSGSDEDRIVAISDSNNNYSNALPGDWRGCNQELNLDQIFDFLTSSEALSMDLDMDDISMMIDTNQNLCYESEAVEDGAVGDSLTFA